MDYSNPVSLRHSPEAALASIAPSCETMGRLPTPDEIKDLFPAQGVLHGFDEHVIVEALVQRRYNVEIIMAKASAPVNGQDARIQILVSPEDGAKPRIGEDGKADFRDIGTLVQVKAGTVLAVKHPATPGSPGKDIYGKPIPRPPGATPPSPRARTPRPRPTGCPCSRKNRAASSCRADGFPSRNPSWWAAGSISRPATSASRATWRCRAAWPKASPSRPQVT